MSNSKIRISNPQTLNGESFYIDVIPYTITDFRWDGGWDSGEFKGYLTTTLHRVSHPPLTPPKFNITLDIYFYMDTQKKEVRFESQFTLGQTFLNPKVSIPIGSLYFLRNKDRFKLMLSKGVSELIETSSELKQLISSAEDWN